MRIQTPVSVSLTEHEYDDVAPLSNRRMKSWSLPGLFFCDCVFLTWATRWITLHQSADTLCGTPCVKCRRLASQMRAFVISKVHDTHLGFEDADVAPLPPRFRKFLEETVKAIAFFAS